MRITAFNGAMRGKRSISHLMAKEFLAGAEQAGAQVQLIDLIQKRFGRCRGCLRCWLRTPGRCAQNDDMAPMLEQYLSSDVVVLATPVFVDNVSGLMKDFMDRLIPITDPHFELDEQGECRHVKRYDEYPGILAMSNSGYPEQSAFDVLRLLFRRVARSMNGRLVGEIYLGGGGVLALDHPMLKPLVERYKSSLRQAGLEVATEAQLSEQTNAALSEQLVPTALYMQQTNAMWDRLASRNRDGAGD